MLDNLRKGTHIGCSYEQIWVDLRTCVHFYMVPFFFHVLYFLPKLYLHIADQH